jgi:hypothetical protein
VSVCPYPFCGRSVSRIFPEEEKRIGIMGRELDKRGKISSIERNDAEDDKETQLSFFVLFV